MISHSHDFIFVHIGRTGGSSLERLAGAQLTLDSRTRDAGNTDFEGKHFTFEEYRARYPQEFLDYFKFTIIRNPYERLVSAWFWRRNVVKDVSSGLAEFALSVPEKWTLKSRMQLNGMSFGESVDVFDFVARYEHLDRDLQYICSKIGLDYAKFPQTNKTLHEDYTLYYDDMTLELVAEKFAFEIDYFNYQFGK